MRRLLMPITALIFVAAACGGSSGSDAQAGPSSTSASPTSSTSSTEPSPPCGSGGVAGEPTEERSMTTSNGEERTYLLDLPSGYDEAAPADVVFNFHGRGSNAIQQYVYGDFVDLAERDGVILVTPNALVRNNSPQWSPGTAGSGGDLDFVAELVEEISNDFCAGSLFATGMSSGGFMTTSLACQADNAFEAFGAVTWWFYDDVCDAAPPRPIIEFHGTDDFVVPFDGRVTGLSILQSGVAWADHNGCDPGPVIEPISEEVDHYRWENCDAVTEQYVVNGGGHTWPGAFDVPSLGAVTDDISASEIVWELFFGAS